MRAADDTARASQLRLKLLRIPEMSTTPSSSPLAGSRTAVAEQVHGLMPAQKCSAPWTRTGPPTDSAVPMALVPLINSFQFALCGPRPLGQGHVAPSRPPLDGPRAPRAEGSLAEPAHSRRAARATLGIKKWSRPPCPDGWIPYPQVEWKPARERPNPGGERR